MIKCTEILNELEAYRSNEVPPELTELISGHLKECQSCRAELKSLERLDELLGTYQITPAPRAIQAGLNRKISEWESARTSYRLHPIWRRAGWLASAAAVMLAALIWMVNPFSGANTEPEMLAEMDLLEDMEIAQLLELDQDYDLLAAMPEIIDIDIYGE